MAPYDIDWEGLKRFISEKEGYERNFGTAAPLTNAQRAAIHTLVPPPQVSPEEATDDINWVSTLLHYLQVHHLTSDIKFTDEPVHLPNPVGKGTDLKWRCFTELPNGEGPFPRDGYGAAADGAGPVFARKQDAKQHAARSVCEYLISNNRMDISQAVFKLIVPSKRKPTAAAAAPPPTAAPSAQTEATRPTKRQGFQDGDVPRQNLPPTSAIPGLSMAPFSSDAIQPRSLFRADSNPPPSILTPGDSVRRSEPRPVAGQVAELARVLKLPLPRYDCVADVGSRNTWSVTADFGDHHLPPVGLGAFSGVFTKQAAKERSAEAVLEWMIGVKEDREQIANKFLEGGLL
ncbi:hypothetical protein D7B24_005840 [Verticillium nonalfalfae]|uniref:DRBM domain-containing protein n=1 Tax=Verticillium nonalfalfae TaxID=1051616 RepID=A0A3M9YBZ7_9PEZI|nr:uncharacterized protein D7B24_005840 [Verticillium nonalfalfae]RNJ57492.1 hypothetical protein D7B24_005840 [Verticillium nonalfalfae]